MAFNSLFLLILNELELILELVQGNQLFILLKLSQVTKALLKLLKLGLERFVHQSYFIQLQKTLLALVLNLVYFLGQNLDVLSGFSTVHRFTEVLNHFLNLGKPIIQLSRELFNNLLRCKLLQVFLQQSVGLSENLLLLALWICT